MINWQLSKQGICWPVSLTVSRAQVSTHRVQVCFWSYRCQVTSFQMIAGSSLIISIHMKYVVFMCRTIKIFISNWPRTRKCSQLLHAGKTVAFNFAHHGHAVRPIFMLWLVNIWQVSSCGNLRSILFTLTAGADRDLCHFLMFLTVFFHWMYKMKFSCYQESSFIRG